LPGDLVPARDAPQLTLHPFASFVEPDLDLADQHRPWLPARRRRRRRRRREI